MEPWRAKLDAGDAVAAWDLFIDRYRRLILATIRRTLDDNDDERVRAQRYAPGKLISHRRY